MLQKGPLHLQCTTKKDLHQYTQKTTLVPSLLFLRKV